ncbi:CsgE family curli-type amyloid fiber assembly protein [Aeromonas rivuli]|jgi:curli production assembly/transport component CsgE|uniref:CsgE family curli-type amyloid fiber assembly protein n=1 Tax=Aeromonas TaxID=642 RepID=UPI0006945021|nr:MULTISPECIES: CsgE family curli-type amyloid fiber assembly protein [Aeromonas]MCS3461318.1 curli production assembly/transport component CsgE [Aeromonas sp. BIGb0445]UBO74389.1 curli production assembly/transport protein CsgE [Aeromonas rivuli]
MRSWLLCLWLISGALAASEGDANAPLESLQPEQENDRIEIGGLVIDRTFTRFGQGFYHHFSRLREDEDPHARENITIHERPTARWGSLIWITHNRKVLFRTALSPVRSQGEAAAQQAWAQVSEVLRQQKVAILFMDTFDLEHDEL